MAVTAKSAWRSVRHFVWGEEPSTRAEKRLLLKIDWFILSYCCLMVRPPPRRFPCVLLTRASAVLHELYAICVSEMRAAFPSTVRRTARYNVVPQNQCPLSRPLASLRSPQNRITEKPKRI